MVAHDVVASAGAVAAWALSEEGDDPGGPVCVEAAERSGPVGRISKETTWAIKVNRAELTMGCGIFFSQFSNKDLGFENQGFQISNQN
jgi:hypothetical protein